MSTVFIQAIFIATSLLQTSGQEVLLKTMSYTLMTPDVYCKFYSTKFEDIRREILANISNSMIDRASVNHATVHRLELNRRKHLNKPNCHLHSLDTIASSVKTTIKANGPGDLVKTRYGSDCIYHQPTCPCHQQVLIQRGSPLLRTVLALRRDCYHGTGGVACISCFTSLVSCTIIRTSSRDCSKKQLSPVVVCRQQYCTTSSLLMHR